MVRMTVNASAEEDRGKYLSFSIGKENFAVDILGVREIIEFSEAVVTSVPLMPTAILGVMNLRGKAVPVVDLGARLTGNSATISRRSCIVITEASNDQFSMELGLLVDSVREVMEIHSNQLEPTPSFGEGISTEFISGMGRVGERFVMLLNIGRVVSMKDLMQLRGEHLSPEKGVA
ncbi:MAG: chemotaxis protein CheW [Gammaproteobacteria bacterium]|nr:chemotaxis protein CheW [Gammaproteobacteria bacterium]